MKIYLTKRASRPNSWYYITDIAHPFSVQLISIGESVEVNNDEIRVDDFGMYIIRDIQNN
jgi:lysophospholipid acyltransferase (LPLAT)-like uncharacterized protein